ncbi:MAG: trimethylamine methyltransferase family protein [bacterium]|nr:trimethylamine methyltransferase family protein [bacterium]
MARARTRSERKIKQVFEGNLYQPLTEEQMAAIHQTSLKIFEEIGVSIKYKPARDLWRKAGALVDDETGVCRIGREIVAHCIAAAPKEFVQYGREPKYDLQQGGAKFYSGTAGEAVSVTDIETGEHRLPTLYDLAAATRLCDALENADIIQNCCYPCEVDRENSDTIRAFTMAANSSKPLSIGTYNPECIPRLYKLCSMILGKEDACRERPFFTVCCAVISPLIMDPGWTKALLSSVEYGFPVVSPSAPTLGSTCPGTLASQLVLCNTEALMTIITVQLQKAGHPCFYSAVPVNMDQRDGSFSFASVEGWIQNSAMNQMAHWHGIPSYTTCGHSDSKMVDAQLGMEVGIGVVLEAMSGANFGHGTFGLLEGGLNLSYESYVIADEYLSMAKRILRGVEVNEETLGFEAIKEQGIGGVFLDHPLTGQHLRTEFCYPKLSNRKPYTSWLEAGSPKYADTARATAREILATHKPLPIDPEIEEAIRAEFPEIPAHAGKIWSEV